MKNTNAPVSNEDSSKRARSMSMNIDSNYIMLRDFNERIQDCNFVGDINS